jgi:hypothetical protein
MSNILPAVGKQSNGERDDESQRREMAVHLRVYAQHVLLRRCYGRPHAETGFKD